MLKEGVFSDIQTLQVIKPSKFVKKILITIHTLEVYLISFYIERLDIGSEMNQHLAEVHELISLEVEMLEPDHTLQDRKLFKVVVTKV